MQNKAAGARLRRYLREGMASAGIDTVAELARRSGVGRDTLQVWMRGDRAPSIEAGQRVAVVIGGSYAEMLRVWEGTDDQLDAERVIESLEWAIRLIRSGQVPPDVARDVAAASRDAARRRRPPG
jgi:transcriptional regulator with XRE-family HTH domain